ncbi:diguanylate cyclase [Aliidiomarina maris]|uniref:diguanylate cyclase n=1 Tax=Aliidiomarina maris TaxID=531312 RepID=A0A327WYS3_9GAMM|nr:diguanylate cyclase [Aliidiomarina maris]RAJ98417.1 diguanylate cyclase (GGDEF)-like protein [Aliidiomarina maris]RUO24768.1 hypothetical protein CWE07_06905 [Aliidiomarina maris]
MLKLKTPLLLSILLVAVLIGWQVLTPIVNAVSPATTVSTPAMTATQAVTTSYSTFRDEALEQQLDAALEVGFYPPNRERFHAILALLDDTTPIDTYVRAKSYRAYELLLAEGDGAAAFALVADLQQRAQQSGSRDAQLEAMLAEAQLLLFDQQPRQAMARIFRFEDKVGQVSSPRLSFFANHLIGRILQENSQYEEALEYFLRSHDVMQNNDRELSNRRLIFVNLHIARIQSELRNDEAALATTIETIELALDSELHARLPDLYVLKGFIERTFDPHTAKQSFEQAIYWADRLGDTRVRLIGRNNLGSVYLLAEQYDAARAILLEALGIANQLEREQDTPVIYFNLGYIQVLEGDYAAGIEQMEQATDAFREYGRQSEVADWLGFMAHAYELSGRYEEQAQTLLEQRRLRDDLFRSERDRVVSALQLRFRSQEQNRRIELLHQQGQLQAEQLSNQQLQQRIVQLVVLVAVLGLCILIFFVRSLRRANNRLNEANKALHDQSIRDPLTGLLNRRSLQQAMESHRRLPSETDAIFLLDIDLFKQVNDIEGHAAGDEVLTTVAERLKRVCRDSDLVVRWGGEEFLIVLRHTHIEALPNFARRLLNTIGEQPMTYAGQSIRVTATAGFVTLPLSTDSDANFDWERAIQLADVLLYYGKAHGRNQVNGLIKVHRPLSPDTQTLLFTDIASVIGADWVTHVYVEGPQQAPK